MSETTSASLPLLHDAAVVTGAAAYTLGRIFDHDEIVERLAARGFTERWAAEALRAYQAIELAGSRWSAEIEKRRASAADSARGPISTKTLPSRQKSPDPVASSPPVMQALSTKQVAARLNLGPRRITQLAKQGKLPGAVRHGRDWSFDAVGVAAFESSRESSRMLSGRLDGGTA